MQLCAAGEPDFECFDVTLRRRRQGFGLGGLVVTGKVPNCPNETLEIFSRCSFLRIFAVSIVRVKQFGDLCVPKLR